MNERPNNMDDGRRLVCSYSLQPAAYGLPPAGAGRKRAFTLVELMVVVVIIGVLATVVTVSVSDYLVTGKQTACRNEIAQLANALELFYMEQDRYPANDEGLAKLKEKTPRHPNGLLQGDLLDPWNHPYVYLHPGLHAKFDILSYGADGLEGGEGADADIEGWNLAGNQKP